MRLALVAAPCARMAIAALTAACLLPALATAADLHPCAGGARCGSLSVPLIAGDPAAGSVNVGFEVYAHRRGAKARDTILVSAGSDGVATTGERAAVLALLAPLRERREGAERGQCCDRHPRARRGYQRSPHPAQFGSQRCSNEMCGAPDSSALRSARWRRTKLKRSSRPPPVNSALVPRISTLSMSSSGRP